ncbi:MAG TPA: Asp-tRNA(Asn)/Glu-tRNA(Gln) amidotransferase subunit GatB [Gaiellaceae bacterium]|nr:Asp-tRNA(Asn)/Glu-tRNA(Gln) amidotransferase subunit GatB [Gaiellaceae bacterium]
MSWEPVIGLEIHVQLKTRTKMFCRCPNGFGAEPNTTTCPVCLGHPGTLPVPNRTAVEWTLDLGRALGCRLADTAMFHRKHYFYPDLAKGYQISQYDEPLCLEGSFSVPGEDGELEVGIVRVHLEEDAAKTVHVGGTGGRIVGAGRSLVDYNRGGVPLVEIVTQPDLHSADDVKRFLQLLRQTVVELGVSDAEMEKGTMRCDANVSVRPEGEEGLRTRWELKNMNSFTFLGRGIDAAVREQVALHEAGKEVVQETYDYDAGSDTLTPHRSKEEADDYRYLPEPDLVPVRAEALAGAVRELPETPAARIRRLAEPVGLATAWELVTTGRDGELGKLVEAGVEPRVAANVVRNEAAGIAIAEPVELARVIEARDRLPRDVYLEAVAASAEAGFSADSFLEREQMSDEASLEPVVDAVLAAHPDEVEAYRGGKQGLLGFFVGQVMKETKGQASPKAVNDLLRERLGE